MPDHIYKSPYGDLFLCHGRYKYIKREWKNGRWNYTYPEFKKENGYLDVNRWHANKLNKVANENRENSKKYSQKISEIRKKMPNAEYAFDLYNTYMASKQAGDKNADAAYKLASYFAEQAEKYGNMAINEASAERDKHDRLAVKYSNDAQKYGKKVMSEKNANLKREAQYASQTRDLIKKWESTPVSKLQTAYHKAADSVKKTLSKWKNALVSAFTPKETVKMITTNPSSGYRSVTTKKK